MTKFVRNLIVTLSMIFTVAVLVGISILALRWPGALRPAVLTLKCSSWDILVVWKNASCPAKVFA